MNMTELQTYVKANQAPCVLFSVSAQADSSSRSKMSYLTMTLGSKSLVSWLQLQSADRSVRSSSSAARAAVYF